MCSPFSATERFMSSTRNTSLHLRRRAVHFCLFQPLLHPFQVGRHCLRHHARIARPVFLVCLQALIGERNQLGVRPACFQPLPGIRQLGLHRLAMNVVGVLAFLSAGAKTRCSYHIMGYENPTL